MGEKTTDAVKQTFGKRPQNIERIEEGLRVSKRVRDRRTWSYESRDHSPEYGATSKGPATIEDIHP
jgi:hypothetical protein